MRPHHTRVNDSVKCVCVACRVQSPKRPLRARHTQSYTHTHTHEHTHTHTHAHTHTHVCVCLCARALTHIHMHIRGHRQTDRPTGADTRLRHTDSQAFTRTHTHKQTHTHTHAYTYTHRHTYTHTRIETNTPVRVRENSLQYACRDAKRRWKRHFFMPIMPGFFSPLFCNGFSGL